VAFPSNSPPPGRRDREATRAMGRMLIAAAVFAILVWLLG